MANPYLSIVIPVYNEALRISQTLDHIQAYLRNKKITYELIVVDDGSQDQTIEVVSSYSGIKLLKNDKNRGKGYSVKRGMLEAKGELRLFMDADHSVKIENLERFIKEIEKGADIVIASIELPGSTIQDDNRGYRRLFGRWSKVLIRLIATPGIYDTQRGFKLFTKKAAEVVFPKQIIDRFGFDIEILVIAQKKGLKIKEIGVDWVNSGSSSVNIWSYLVTLYELVKIKMCV